MANEQETETYKLLSLVCEQCGQIVSNKWVPK